MDWESLAGLRGKQFYPPSWKDMVRHLKEFDRPDAMIPQTMLPHFEWAVKQMEARHGCTVALGVPSSPIGELEGPSMDTFPGILARSYGYKTKAESFDSAWTRAYNKLQRLYQGEVIEAKPVACFGRGKVVSLGEGDTAGGQPKRRGRLVMAPEIDDHILMSTFSQPCAAVVKRSFEKGIIMYGMSPFNRGGTIFLNNLVADLCPHLTKRVPWHEEPSADTIKQMDQALQAFEAFEENFVYIKMDFSRYDSRIGSQCGNAALQSMSKMYRRETKAERRKVGRAFKYIEDSIIRTKVCLPDGQIWRKNVGNTTGSPFTTLYNSWTDGIYMLAAVNFLLCGKEDPRVTLRVHGDDNILIVPKDIHNVVNLQNMKTVLEDGLHLQVNADESSEHSRLIHRYGMKGDETVSFLGRRYMLGGAAWRSLDTTLEHIVHPDSEDYTPNGALSRCNGLLLDNPFNERAAFWCERVMDRLTELGASLTAPSMTELRKYVHGFGMSMDAFEKFERMSRLQARDMYVYTETQRSLLPSYTEGPLDYIARLGGQMGLHQANWRESSQSETRLDDLDLPTRQMGRSAAQQLGMTAVRTIEAHQRLKKFLHPGRRARRQIQGMGRG